MADFHDSKLKGFKTRFEGVSWHGANTEGIINETKTLLPGKEELMLESETVENKSIFSFIKELFSREKDHDNEKKLTPALPKPVEIIPNTAITQSFSEPSEALIPEIKSEAPITQTEQLKQNIFSESHNINAQEINAETNIKKTEDIKESQQMQR